MEKDSLKPKIRFKKYTDNWEKISLKELLLPVERKTRKPNIQYKSLGVRSHFKGTIQRYDRDPKSNSMEYLYLVKKDDFILNITFAWEGALAIAGEEDDGGFVSHRFPTYRINSERITNRFFGYIYPTEKMKYNLRNISPGGAGRNRVLNKKDFLGLRVKIPTIDEQQKIADFLGTLDALIQNLKSQKVTLEKYKKGIMQKIFSQEIRFKGDSGNDFPDWETIRLGSIAKFKKGKGISKADIAENGSNKCIRYGELYTEYKECIDNVVSKTNVTVKNSVISHSNDSLMPTSDVTPNGLATASALNEDSVILGGDILIIRSEELNNLFFAYLINLFF